MLKVLTKSLLPRYEYIDADDASSIRSSDSLHDLSFNPIPLPPRTMLSRSQQSIAMSNRSLARSQHSLGQSPRSLARSQHNLGRSHQHSLQRPLSHSLTSTPNKPHRPHSRLLSPGHSQNGLSPSPYGKRPVPAPRTLLPAPGGTGGDSEEELATPLAQTQQVPDLQPCQGEARPCHICDKLLSGPGGHDPASSRLVTHHIRPCDNLIATILWFPAAQSCRASTSSTPGACAFWWRIKVQVLCLVLFCVPLAGAVGGRTGWAICLRGEL